MTNTDAYIGRYPEGIGSAIVTGSNSKWLNSGNLHIGEAGEGRLTIEAGGAVSNNFGEIGIEAGSLGAVKVAGGGSTWANAATLFASPDELVAAPPRS